MTEQYPTAYGPSSAVARPTEVMAVLGLVFAIVFWPLGIVLSALALRRTRRNETAGHGMALAGLIIGIAFGVLTVLFAVLLVVVANASVAP